ncbi:MAG TPA: alpha-L-rhamnosidase, partial [Roseiflexaceae bacterium]|nr:alpha-L-rhamnosidase [Roseiflexaceae bacterium]
TAYIDNIAGYNRYGQSTAVNSLYYSTLQVASEVAEGLGDTPQALSWRQKATAIKSAMTSYLYRPAEGRYITTIFEGRVYEPTTYAQAWALAYGVAPEAEQQRVADSLLEMISRDPARPNLQIFGMFWALDGLGRAGRIQDSIDLIKLYYGYMLDRGATTWWEHFSADRTYTASLSHGWGVGPTWFLVTYVLGARQTGPNAWSLQPALGSVPQASGSLPLKDGAVGVSWHSQACGSATLRVDAPSDSRGNVEFALDADTTTVTLNGKVVWRAGRTTRLAAVDTTNMLRVPVPGGLSTFGVDRQC